MTTLRKLDELSCKQLKEELRDRELRIFCDKEKMRASLWQALVDEGEDPETYVFEIEPDIGEVLNTMQNWLCELCTFQYSMNHSMDKLIRNVQGQINPVRERSPSFNNNEPLLIQDYGCTDSYKECVNVNKKNADEQKETVEAIEEVCYATETFDVPALSATTTRTEQDNFEPVTLDLKDPCRSTYEGNLNFDCCIQAVSNNCTCGASRRECKCQETHQQGLKPVDFDTSVFTRERGLEGGQKNPAADELVHVPRRHVFWTRLKIMPCLTTWPPGGLRCIKKACWSNV
ncbi:uncharacterized protein LOC129928066 [Biomphalaria glabrata]|uniref:Uncharacterized protein LOC129928066 n=1 Tax=Biomphalaria glabrata TaxID=6526 RepID=A0A9W3B9R4_BIOGL|nr:uncharacterized protein LOC129928066 [Biomphalaria glabrata]